MPLYDACVPQLSKMLSNLSNWLDEAEQVAKSKRFEPSVLLAARLAPDQYPLLRQIQASCDTAKFTLARLSGKTPPTHPDTEQTWEEIRARVAAVIEYLNTFEAKDFDGAEQRVIPLPFLPGKALKAGDYLNEMALPNFYFHLNIAYAILRHNGVPLGKTTYVGSLNLVDV